MAAGYYDENGEYGRIRANTYASARVLHRDTASSARRVVKLGTTPHTAATAVCGRRWSGGSMMLSTCSPIRFRPVVSG